MTDYVEDIRSRCASVGVKPEAVLQQAGLHRATWFRWASGASSPRLATLRSVERLLTEMEARVPS